MPLDQLLNGAVGFVLSRQQPPGKTVTVSSHAANSEYITFSFQANWSSSNIPSMIQGSTTNAAMLGDSNIGTAEEACAICGYALRLQPMCSLQPCSHVVHSAVRSIMSFYGSDFTTSFFSAPLNGCCRSERARPVASSCCRWRNTPICRRLAFDVVGRDSCKRGTDVE